MSPACWCCGVDLHNCRGYLKRMNRPGDVPAVWECCPSCRPPLPLKPCKLYVDGIPNLQAGHYLVTLARGVMSSGYLVLDLRQSRAKPQRRNLTCERVRPVDIPGGSTVHLLHWYSRSRKR